VGPFEEGEEGIGITCDGARGKRSLAPEPPRATRGQPESSSSSSSGFEDPT